MTPVGLAEGHRGRWRGRRRPGGVLHVSRVCRPCAVWVSQSREFGNYRRKPKLQTPKINSLFGEMV